MDLIRELMLQFEKGDRSVPEGRTKQEVAYHVKQLIDAGFLDGEVMMAPSPGRLAPRDYELRDITWKGHDFIEAVKNEAVWHRAKAYFKQKSGPWIVDLILEFLKSEGRKAIGL